MPLSDSEWLEANQVDLLIRIAAVKRRLAQRVDDEAASAIAMPVLKPAQAAVLQERRPAFVHLAETFGLSGFEQDILLLCAGVEIDATVPALCAAIQGDPARPYPSFGMALATLAEPHWAALAPDAALRRWRLIELGNGHVLDPLAAADRRARAALSAGHRRDRRAVDGADRSDRADRRRGSGALAGGDRRRGGGDLVTRRPRAAS